MPNPKNSDNEKRAEHLFGTLKEYILQREGCFQRDKAGFVNVLLDGQSIRLDFERTNIDLAGLMLKACGVGSLTPTAHSAIQRLQVFGAEQASNVEMKK